jgi:hypothetical protein
MITGVGCRSGNSKRKHPRPHLTPHQLSLTLKVQLDRLPIAALILIIGF